MATPQAGDRVVLADGSEGEVECTQADSRYSGLAFRAAARGVDPTRPVSANGALDQTPTAQLDIQVSRPVYTYMSRCYTLYTYALPR